MNIFNIGEVVLGIIASIGGIGIVFSAVVKFSVDIIADRLSERYEFKLEKELEKYKSQLESENHISKEMFDKEFHVYQLLTEVYCKSYALIQQVHTCELSKDKIVSAKEILAQNIPDEDLWDYMIGLKKEPVITDIQVLSIHEDAIKALFEFQSQIKQAGPFIPHDNYKLFLELGNSCLEYLKSPSEENFQKIKITEGKMNVLLQKYLKSLIIVN